MILGIDPGKDGAMVILNNDRTVMDYYCFHHPDYKRPNLTNINQFLAKNVNRIDRACLEQAHSMPKQGVKAMFTFGRYYGQIEGLLEAYQIPIERVTARQWTSVMHQGLDKSLKPKERSCLAVKREWPVCIPLLWLEKQKEGLYDAMLLGLYSLIMSAKP